MNTHTKLSTDAILEQIEQGQDIGPECIDFIEKKEVLEDLWQKILESYSSLSKFAIASYISPSHMNEFINGKKQMDRNKLICICIVLKFNIQETRHLLQRFGGFDLYSRNRRDFEILNCIKCGKNLDDTNEILRQKGLPPLHNKDLEGGSKL